MVKARAYADSGLVVARKQVDATPKDPQLRVLYAVMLALAGKSDEAIAESDKAVSSIPTSGYSRINRDYVALQSVRVDMILKRHDEAMEKLEKLVARPGFYTRQYLNADPIFAPLKKNQRFERILAGGIGVNNG
jgi:hypothetical protein